MKLSDAGIDLVAKFEGRRLTVYADPVGLPSVGIGHLLTAAERKKWPVGTKLTAAEVDALFRKDVARFEQAVNDKVLVTLNQGQFDALVSLAFNIGAGAFAKSSLLKSLNAGCPLIAANKFLEWNKAGGKVLSGLTKRRQAERELFLTASAPIEQPKPLGPEIKTAFKYLYALPLSKPTLALLNKLRGCPEFASLK